MDMEMLKTDLDHAVKQLPKNLLTKLADLVLADREEFAKALPVLMGLMPHIRAGAMEAAMGIVNVKDLEDTVTAVLTENGIKLPAPTETHAKAG